MSSLSTSAFYGMFHNSASHYGLNVTPPMRDGCTTASTFVSALSTIQTNGGRAIWRVVGSADAYSWISGNGQSAYSHPMWKAAMDTAAAKTSAAQMHAFWRAGTLLAVELNDDIEPGSIYPGGAPTGVEIEDEAAYSKSKWSLVPTTVRCRTGYLKTIAPGGSFTSLDFGWAQWKFSRGNVQTWFTNEINDGRSCKLGLMVGFNLLDGGQGVAPWDQHPNDAAKFGMSPTEINAVAAAFSSATYAIGVIGWAHDNTRTGTSYYDDPQINAALTNVANVAIGRAQGPINWQSGNTSASSQTVAGGWSLRAVGTRIRNGDVASQSVAMPTTFSAGNLLGILGYSRDSARSFVAPSSLWSLSKSVSGSSARGGQLTLIHKIADGTEGNQTVTWAGTGGTGMSVMCQSFAFSGNSSGGVLSTVGSGSTWGVSSDMGPVKGGFTSAVSDALVLVCAAKGNDFNPTTDPPADGVMSTTTSGGETWHRGFINHNGSGDDCAFFMDWAALSGTPSITTKSWTQTAGATSGSAGSGAGFLVSFRPAAVVAGQPPSITAIPDFTISTLSTVSFTPTSTGSTPITWSVNTSIVSSVITFSTSNGQFIWTPGANGEGVFPFVMSATNTFGSDTEPFTATVVSSGTTGSIVSSSTTASGSTVTVLSGSSGTSFTQNVAPVILNPGDQNARTGERVSLYIQCADADNDPLICYLEPTTAPAGSLFDNATNQFLWTPRLAGTYPFSIIASDGQHTSSSTFTITVNDSRWHRSGRGPTTDFSRTNSSGNQFRRI